MAQFVQQYYVGIIFVLLTILLFKNRVLSKIYKIEDISVADAYTLHKKNSAKTIFIDVRTPWEFDKDARIKRSKSYPLSELKSKLGELKKTAGTDRKIVIICRSASRSRKAAIILKKAGFDYPLVMVGGLISWQRASYPVHKAKPRPTFS